MPLRGGEEIRAGGGECAADSVYGVDGYVRSR